MTMRRVVGNECSPSAALPFQSVLVDDGVVLVYRGITFRVRGRPTNWAQFAHTRIISHYYKVPLIARDAGFYTRKYELQNAREGTDLEPLRSP